MHARRKAERLAGAICLWLTALLGGCAGLSDEARVDYFWIVHNPERSDADRVTDQRRRPEKLLEFYEVRPGMRVLDVSAGAGYNTELLARVVGPTGVVYAQNSRYFLEKFVRGRFDERLKKPVMRRVVHVVRDFDDPLPADVRNLDLVTFNFNYHDTVWLGVDRAKMNRAVFNALKPGGIYIVADHSAQPGAGIGVARSLHRIEESVVRREVEAAGFKFVAEGGFLRNPADPRDASVFKPRIPNDEFVLKFVKP
ncbi:MAG: class I SAM-dependent methyltransferase [Betaproteobacteria bacterium]|nr:class I SAM-dependent methyltransferase [Betaproteobacteria bacterium]